MAGITTVGAQSAKEMDQTLDDLYGAHGPYHAFFETLKKAVAGNDKGAVASMVEYPFKARINGKAVTIRDAAHFAADYDKVFTAKVKGAVSNQTYPKLFANWQGVMIGDGEVWFSGIGDNNTVKIIAVND
ncbi:cyclopropane fatty-acyl-phospholipid synthase-like methyltransferase [Mesorhizobium robiniae]|uniref:Cyclopropane fatty-acyl-phospholipid synthase-like methyltransferase n=1 Tax=Mesorhizobium robiniae TaxID=559315 RepID=A0ABV2GL86_9HYPH